MDFYRQITDWELFRNSGETYFQAVILFCVLILAFKVFQMVMTNKLEKISQKTETDIDDLVIKIVESIRPPFYLLMSLYVSLKFFEFRYIIEKVIDAVAVIAIVIQVSFVLQIVISYMIEKIASRTKEKGEGDGQEVIYLVGRVVKISLWIVAFLVILSNMGINVTSLITGLGIGGIAIALAVQNVLGDMFSSFSIAVDKPFKVGDFIVVGKDSGVVKKIGIKSTRIKTLQGEELVVSNKDLTTARVQNFKMMEKRRVALKLGVVYGTDLDKLKSIPAIIQKIIEGVGEVTFERSHFKNYGEFSLNFETVYFVESSSYEKYMDIQQQVNLGVYEAFRDNGIDFAYPTQTVFVNNR